MSRSYGLVAVLLATLGCKSLPDIESGVCGNGVKEGLEACDTFAEGEGMLCRPPGIVGEECQHDCRVQDDGTRPNCPENFGCAADGICRSDTRTFEPAAAPISTVACSWLSAADFDGDGREEVLSAEPPDALQQARFRLHYFERDGTLEETRTFPRLTTRPVTLEVGADERADLAFTNLRVGMVPGRADREWLPAAFSSYVVPNAGLRILGVAEAGVGHATPLVAITALDERSGLYVPDYGSGRLDSRSEIAGPVQELAGLPLAADVIAGVGSPCAEVVLAFRGDSRFYVYDMCESSANDAEPEVLWRAAAIESTVALPAGLAIDAGPLAGDVDGDGHLDIVVGAGGRAFVARGDGAGLEPVASALSVLYEDALLDSVVTHETQLPMPLALGDLSGDGIADFVLPGGVISSYTRLSVPGVRYVPSLGNRGAPWTTAQVLDLNGNGYLDAVAASENQPGLTFVNGTGGPHQIEARLVTRGPVRFLAAGDFDGDLIGDVAFVEEGAVNDEQFLSLAFGVRDTPPAVSRQIAALQHVEQLGIHAEAGFDHLHVTSNETRRDGPVSTLTLFDGNSDRLPFAPYSLVTFAEDENLEDSSALALAAGDFSADGASDVVALGVARASEPWELWLLPDMGSAKPPRRLRGSTDGYAPLTVDGLRLMVHVAAAAGDVDGDGLAESLWLMPDSDGSCALLLYQINEAAGTFTERGVVGFDQGCPQPELALADLDGDRALDVLALVGDAERAPRSVRVLWNDGSGAFSAEASTPIGDPRGADIRAFSAFPALHTDEPGRRVAFVSTGGLRVAEPSAAARHVAYDLIREVQSLDEARAVVVTDPNGDGVADIVAADAHGLWLFRAALR